MYNWVWLGLIDTSKFTTADSLHHITSNRSPQHRRQNRIKPTTPTKRLTNTVVVSNEVKSIMVQVVSRPKESDRVYSVTGEDGRRKRRANFCATSKLLTTRIPLKWSVRHPIFQIPSWRQSSDQGDLARMTLSLLPSDSRIKHLYSSFL